MAGHRIMTDLLFTLGLVVFFALSAAYCVAWETI